MKNRSVFSPIFLSGGIIFFWLWEGVGSSELGKNAPKRDAQFFL
jgi:hypothetical protein